MLYYIPFPLTLHFFIALSVLESHVIRLKINCDSFFFFHLPGPLKDGVYDRSSFFWKHVSRVLDSFKLMRSGIRGKRRQKRSFYKKVRWNAFCHLLPWPEWPITHLPAIRFWPHFSGQLAFNGKCLWDRYTIYCIHCSRASVSRKITEQKTA